jgi:tRNA 2-thiouridine synthesizing protein A
MPACCENPALTWTSSIVILPRMNRMKLDLTGLKCPLPALKTRKALKPLQAGDQLEVHCTDPLSVIDIPNLIRETGDRVEITERSEQRIVFLIEKTNGATET